MQIVTQADREAYKIRVGIAGPNHTQMIDIGYYDGTAEMQSIVQERLTRPPEVKKQKIQEDNLEESKMYRIDNLVTEEMQSVGWRYASLQESETDQPIAIYKAMWAVRPYMLSKYIEQEQVNFLIEKQISFYKTKIDQTDEYSDKDRNEWHMLDHTIKALERLKSAINAALLTPPQT
jgi:hypothetical protein